MRRITSGISIPWNDVIDRFVKICKSLTYYRIKLEQKFVSNTKSFLSVLPKDGRNTQVVVTYYGKTNQP